jgi:N-methylhydantoinase A
MVFGDAAGTTADFTYQNNNLLQEVRLHRGNGPWLSSAGYKPPAPSDPNTLQAELMDLAERFHDLHQADRGFSFRQQEPTVRGVRITALGRTPKPPRLAELGTGDAAGARTGSRDVYFGHGFVDTPVYDGTQLGPGASIDGPALVEEPFTVVVVPPGAHLTLGDHASYELVLAGAS